MNDSSAKQKPGCLRIGCCSCLLLVALILGGVAFLGSMQFLFERDDQPLKQETFSRELPTLTQFDRLRAGGEVGSGELVLEPGTESLAPEARAEATVNNARPGSFEEAVEIGGGKGLIRVELDLGLGEFEIVRGEPGGVVVVEARYDQRAIAYSEDFEPGADGGGVVKIRSGPRGGAFGAVFRGAGGGPKNFVTIKLPPDVPLALVGTLGIGESELNLGGLLLREIDLVLGTGDHNVTFDEPLLAPLERLSLEKRIGATRIGNLGNASPRRVDVRQSVGELWIDLRGAWLNDATISASNRVGELNLEPPTNAHLRTGDGSFMIGERKLDVKKLELPEGAPTLSLELSASVGEISIHSH